MTKARLVTGENDAAAQYIIRKLLTPEYEIVAVAPNGKQVLDCVERHAPDLVLLDIGMPVMSGIAVARTLKRTMPATRMIFVSTYADEAYINEAVRLGADAYVLKSQINSDLRPAIEKALAGKQCLSAVIEVETKSKRVSSAVL